MYKINKYITLDLQQGKTKILLEGSEFLVCKAVFVDINRNMEEIIYNSIDEVVDDDDTRVFVPISPEEEFWVHCSNLQAWAENNYNTALLHSNIAFPLLEELTRLGDPLAIRVFKDEVVKRLTSDHMPTVFYLLKHWYLDIFTEEEYDLILGIVKEKSYSIDKSILDMVFISSDFDEVPPLDRFRLKAIIFLIEHPKINLLELLIKFGQSYIEKFRFWILNTLKQLLKHHPDFFREKVELLLKGKTLPSPKDIKIEREFNGTKYYEHRLDYSNMNEFSILLYLRYKLKI